MVKKGKDWLPDLSTIVDRAAAKFGLSNIEKARDLAHNYILSALQGDKEVILKIGMDNEGLKKEASTLRYFNGFGAVNILIEAENMLLLEKVIPGTPLKNYFRDKDADSIEIACKVMKKLHKAGLPVAHKLPHIKDWLSILDKDLPMDNGLLLKARLLRDKLLDSAGLIYYSMGICIMIIFCAA